MIGFIKGALKNFTQTTVILFTDSGVGYEIEYQNFSGKQIGEIMELWVHTHVRENEIKLFGFDDLSKKKMFELLITVSGVGPKIAHLVVSYLSIAEIQEAVLMGEPKAFTKISGVGKKVSERIILELKEKLSKDISQFPISDKDVILDSEDSLSNQNSVKEVFEALSMLGYSSESIREALKDEDLSLSSKELIKICLKKIRS